MSNCKHKLVKVTSLMDIKMTFKGRKIFTYLEPKSYKHKICLKCKEEFNETKKSL